MLILFIYSLLAGVIMLFEKDSFTKHLDQLKEHLSAAENIMSVIEYTETGIDTRALNQINKALESASNLIKRLYTEISTKKIHGTN